jgi:hypothetical protein
MRHSSCVRVALCRSCVNQPQCKHILRLLRACLDAAGASSSFILPSLTNVTQTENVQFLSSGAHLVYHLPLAALLLHTLYSHSAAALNQWLVSLPVAPPGGGTLLNLAASHDGVGLTWCRSILSAAQIERLCEHARRRGGSVQTRRAVAGAREEEPWEICIAGWSACACDDAADAGADVDAVSASDSAAATVSAVADAAFASSSAFDADAGSVADAPPQSDATLERHIDRFMAVHTVVAALRGVPAFYFSLLVAGANDHARTRRLADAREDPERCCLPRALNRGRFDEAAWRADCARPATRPQARVLARFQSVLSARTASAAFHPDAPQSTLLPPSMATAHPHFALPDSVLFLRRGGANGDERAVSCFTNFSDAEWRGDAAAAIELVGAAARFGGGVCVDLLSRRAVDLRLGLRLRPYQTVWLAAHRIHSSAQLMEMRADAAVCVSADPRVDAARLSAAGAFLQCDAPARILRARAAAAATDSATLATDPPFDAQTKTRTRWQYRAVSPDSEQGRTLLARLMGGNNTVCDRVKVVTFVHHGQSTHKLKRGSGEGGGDGGDRCMCFESTLPAPDQIASHAAFVERNGRGPNQRGDRNACPYFDEALIDPPLTEQGALACAAPDLSRFQQGR